MDSASSGLPFLPVSTWLYGREADCLSIILTTKNTKNTENPVSNTGQAPGLFNPYVPLRPSADTLPAFPIHCLPPRLQAYVAAVAEHTQTPVDMAAGVALGVLATCLQGKVRVEGNPGHYEQTSLYVFIVANPGARKSAVIRAMTSIIEDYEQAHNEKLKPQIRKRRQERETLQRQINRLNRQLEQKYDSMTELELQHAQDNLADLPAIQPLQIFTDDCTSEMMVKLLKDNGGRMALISAEGGAFDAIIGRYSKKPNLDVWLKDISADTIRRAVCIGRYAFQHAMYAYSIISADETIEKALHVVSRLRNHRIRDISQSALYQLCLGRFFRDAKELEPVLELLEQHGYIWRDTLLYSGVGRPPSRTIYVNPVVTDEQ